MTYRARPRTRALFPLLELASDLRPAEVLGRVSDLAPLPANPLPGVVATDRTNENKLTSRGRAFGIGLGLVGTDQLVDGVTDHTRLIRDVTVRAFVDYAIANHSDGEVGTLCIRGRNDGTVTERELFGVTLERVSATVLRVRAKWQSIAGVGAVLAGAAFGKPPGFFQLAVTRRWETSTDVRVVYYVNDIRIGSEVVTVAAQNDIGGGVGGQLIIGARGTGFPGPYTGFLPLGTVIDQLSIEADAMTAEELRSDYRRQQVHLPEGGRILRLYQPPGDTYSTRPDSLVQRWIEAEGEGLGDAIGEASRLLDDGLPDRAYGRTLARWEEITGLSPLPGDTVQVRRERVLGFLRKILGYSIPDVKLALEPLFGLDSSDIDIVEYGPRRTDDFAIDDISAPPSKMWVTNVGDGTVAITGGICRVTMLGGNRNQWDSGTRAPYRKAALTPPRDGDARGASFVTKITITGHGLTDHFLGHIWFLPNKDAVFLGFRNAAGTRELVSYTVLGGVTSAFTVHAVAPSGVVWLLTRYLGAGLYDLRVSTVGPAGPFTSSLSIAGPALPLWVAFGGANRGAVVTAATIADFDDALLDEPRSVRPLAWQAYRDPGLPGTFDLRTAQLQLDKQRPAHTAACAVTTLAGFTLGPSGTGKLNCDPLFPQNQLIS